MGKRRLSNALLESQTRFGEVRIPLNDVLSRLLEASETKIEEVLRL